MGPQRVREHSEISAVSADGERLRGDNRVRLRASRGGVASHRGADAVAQPHHGLPGRRGRPFVQPFSLSRLVPRLKRLF